MLSKGESLESIGKHQSSGGSKGGARDARAPWGVQILSISCSFWEILANSYVGAPLGSWRPLLREILDPPLQSHGSQSFFTEINDNYNFQKV